MHSPYETAGVRDSWYMIRAIREFYQTHIVATGDGSWKLL